MKFNCSNKNLDRINQSFLGLEGSLVKSNRLITFAPPVVNFNIINNSSMLYLLFSLIII